MKYRMYVDEVGNADTAVSEKPEQRYLSLTGVVFELDDVQRNLFPKLEALKQTYFSSHPDEPVVLHRKDIMRQRPPFHCLKDPETDKRFRQDLLDMLTRLDYLVVTATIDKLEYHTRYKKWRYHPYHYGLEVLVDGFIGYLERNSGIGDVMVESRGDKEDKRLRANYGALYSRGTDSISPEIMQARLTSQELKVKLKAGNVAGLQMADLIAYPSYRVALCRNQQSPLPSDMNGSVGQILLDSKYDRSPSGRVEGWGLKWLP